MSAGASIESLPSDIQYIIARAFLPALCAVRACCKTLRAALWNSHLKSEAELWLYPEEVTLGTCELIATLPALERVIIAHGQWGGCGAVRQLGDWLLRIDVTALREASSICIHPAVPKLRAACRYRDWAAGMDSCVWAVTLADENSLHRTMNAEAVGLLCAPLLRSNPRLVKLVTRCAPAARGGIPVGPSHINVPLLRSGRCERWSQIFMSATRSLSPETPLDNLSAVLVAGLLAPPVPLELRIDLTGLRAVCGAALAFAEARAKRRFIRPQEQQPSLLSTATPHAIFPTALARSKLLAARVAHRNPWGVGPNASVSDAEHGARSTSGRLLRPLLVTMCGHGAPLDHPVGKSPLSLPELIAGQVSAWVARRWQQEHGQWWQAELCRDATQADFDLAATPSRALDIT